MDRPPRAGSRRGLDDERFIATWVELALAYAAEHGIRAPGAKRA